MTPGSSETETPLRISLVVPCYNEASRLDIASFRRALAACPAVRLIFVDDGSSDLTLSALKEICIGHENHAHVVQRSRNAGKGEAVRAGVNHALHNFEQDVVGYWDADLATPLDAVDSLVTPLRNDPKLEMVFGSRVQLLGRHVERSAARHYLGRIFATAVSTVLQLPVYDTQCGAKLFRANQHLQMVFTEPFLSKWVFDVEIIARYMQLYGGPTAMATKIYEYPLNRWVDVRGSKVHPGDFFTAFIDIIKIKRKYL